MTLETVHHLLEREDTGGIDEGHAPHAQDQHTRTPLDMRQRALELLRGAKEKRPVDQIHQHIAALFRRSSRDAGGRIARCASIRAARIDLDIDRLGHAPHEQQCRQHHPDIHRHDQIDAHGQAESQQQDNHIGPRSAARQAQKVRQLAHVPGDNEQDRRERAQRNRAGQRRQQHDHQHQEQAVHDTGQRAGGAVADIGGSAGDRSGRGEAAE